MAIHTVIMAGGSGTRLLPLTAACPKPLAPLCGAPLMDYTLRLLKKHGFTQADAKRLQNDYERFIRTFRSDKCEVLELRKVDWCNELFVKVVRKGTMMKDTVFGRELWGINIDIFPMDMFPADAEHTVCDEIRRKRELLAAIAPYYKTFPRGLNRTRWHLKYIAKRIAKPYFHSILHLKAGIDSLASSYKGQETPLEGGMLGGYLFREVMEADVFRGGFTELAFEGRKYKAIAGYDRFLRHLYGDYMQLPPADKQVSTHYYDAYVLD